MKRILLLTALFCSLLTPRGAEPSQRSQRGSNFCFCKVADGRHREIFCPHRIQSSGSYGGHDYVDLGLPSGTLWATCNVGALKPEEYGDHFAWGETKPKQGYCWSSYFDIIDEGWGLNKAFKKYNYDSGKTELDLANDAAYVNWGSGWRMPSRVQQNELMTKCT